MTQIIAGGKPVYNQSNTDAASQRGSTLKVEQVANSKLRKKLIWEDSKGGKKSFRSIFEQMENEDFCDDSFKKYSEETLISRAIGVLDNIEHRKQLKKVIALERKVKDKETYLNRVSGRQFSEYTETIEEAKKMRIRNKNIRSIDQQLSRQQLALSKAKARLDAKVRKHARRMTKNASKTGLVQIQSYDVSDQLFEWYNTLEDMLRKKVESKYMYYVLDIAHLIIVFMRTSDIYIRISTVIQVIKNYIGVDKLDDTLRRIAAPLLNFVGNVFNPEEQSLAEDLGSSASMIDKILSTEFTNAVRKLFMGITTYMSFPKEITAVVFKYIGSTAMKLSVLSLIKEVLTIGSKLLNAASLWYYGDACGKPVPISELLFGANMMDTLNIAYSDIKANEDNTYMGLPVEGKMYYKHFVKKMQDYIDTATAYVEAIGNHNPAATPLRMRIIEIRNMSQRLKVKYTADARVPAFGVMLVGPPGVGKSITIPILCSRPSIIRGDSFTMQQVHYQNADQEYWEGYKPWEHTTVFTSEIAKKHKSLAQKTGDDSLNSMLSAIDSNPYALNMAFGDKANVYFLAEQFIFDTNNRSLNFDVLFDTPAAFWRRLLIIEQSIAPGWTKEATHEVDYNKVKQGVRDGIIKREVDVFLYSMYYNVPAPGGQVQPAYIEQHIKLERMLELYDQLFYNHVKKNSDMNNVVRGLIKDLPSNIVDPNLESIFLRRDEAERKALDTGHIINGPKILYPEETGQQMISRKTEEFSNAFKKLVNMGSSDNPMIKPPVGLSQQVPEFTVDKINQAKYVELLEAKSDFSNLRCILDRVEDFVIVDEKDAYSDTFKFSPYDTYTVILDELSKVQYTSIRRSDLELLKSRLNCVKYNDKIVENQSGKHDFDNYIKTKYEKECLVYEVDESAVLRKIEVFVYGIYYFVCWQFLSRVFDLGINKERLFSYLGFCILLYFFSPYASICFVLLLLLVLYTLGTYNTKKLKYNINRYKIFMLDCGARLSGTNKYIRTSIHYVSKHYGLIKAIGAMMTVVAIVGVSARAFSSRKKKETEQESVNRIATNGQMDEYDAKVGATGAIARVKCKNDPHNWNLVNTVVPGTYTQDRENFQNMLYKQTYNSWCGIHVSKGFLVSPNVMVINTHYLNECKLKNEPLCFSLDEKRSLNPLEGSKTLSLDIGNDISIVYVPRTSRNMLKHIATGNIKISKAYIDNTEVGAIYFDDILTTDDTPNLTNSYYQYNGYQGKGLCGNVLYVQIKNTWTIIGLHCAGAAKNASFGVPDDIGYSTVLDKNLLMAGIRNLEIMSKGKFVNCVPENNALIESLGEPRVNSKSPFMHIHLPGIDYHGTYGKVVLPSKSQVEPNIFETITYNVATAIGTPQTKYFNAPLMRPAIKNGIYVSPQNNALKHFCKPDVVRNDKLLIKVQEYLKVKLLGRIKSEKPDVFLKPYTINESINGSPNDDYSKRINASTAGGFGFKGKKRDYMPLGDDGVTRVLDQRVLDRIQIMLDHYSRGENSGVIYNVSLKDEPVSQKKRDQGITRLFYCQDLATLVLSRSILGPFVTLMQELDSFYCEVGINMYRSADKVYSKFNDHARYTEVDAEKFDIKAQNQICHVRMNIVIYLCEQLGYNEQALSTLRGLLSDLMSPYLMLDGDLFSKSIIASGHYGTAELNCMFILIMCVYTFMKSQEEGTISSDLDFFENISGSYFGDDQGNSVSEAASMGFNNIKIKEAFADFEMSITASDKCSTLTDFVPIKDATFLKRSFRKSVKYGMVLAPLEPNSIYKMCSWSIYGDNCTRTEHDISVANSALNEIFLHICDDEDSVSKYNGLRDLFIKRMFDVYGVDTSGSVFTYLKCSELIL